MNERGGAAAPEGDGEVLSVSRLRRDWAVHEDGALAHRLQSQEIQTHLFGNKQRNNQIRQDFPRAVEEQTKEQLEMEVVRLERLRQQQQLEAKDAELAQKLSRELDREELEHRQYELTKDELFARRIQEAMERQSEVRRSRNEEVAGGQVAQDGAKGVRIRNKGKPAASTSSTVPSSKPKPTTRAMIHRPEPEGTPPLPVLPNGDVPSSAEETSHDLSFHDLHGGLRYNDDQYLLKTAMPAVVKAEPLYANNKPDYYAVSKPFPLDEEQVGAVGGGARSTLSSSAYFLSIAGISQKDLVISKTIEAQLEQEKKDLELAKKLQQELIVREADLDTNKAEIEARDLELAKQLHAKEKAKLRRAKERSKLKKLQQQQQQQEAAGAVGATTTTS